MCGIVVIASRPSDREPPDLAPIAAAVRGAHERLTAVDLMAADLAEVLDSVAGELRAAGGALSGVPGVRALIADPLAAATIEHAAADVTTAVAQLEARLEAALEAGRVPVDVELLNAG